MSGWNPLGALPPEDLVEARLELHHAAQLLVIGVGSSLIPPRPDWSHTALTWGSDANQWITEPIPDSDSVRAGLRPADFALTLTDGSHPPSELHLAGQTTAQAFAWLKRSLEERDVDTNQMSAELPYEIPEHPVATGSPFEAALLPQLSELGRYFADADLLLQEIVRESSGASPVYTWGHHFDTATLISFPTPEGQEARSIGVGLSPGDGHYPVPYFYVTPWPYPVDARLPALPSGGEWHTKGWTGAVLQAPRLTAAVDGDEQERRVRDFLSAAIGAAQSLLGEG